MRKTAIAIAFLVLSGAGVATANYFIQSDYVQPCTNWKQVTLENGGWSYVCSSWPWQSVEVPDGYDTIKAINDLDSRVSDLEAEISNLRAKCGSACTE